MRTHSSIRARREGKMTRRRHHPFRGAFWALDPRSWPRAIREDRATSGIRRALKRSSNAKRRRRDVDASCRQLLGEDE